MNYRELNFRDFWVKVSYVSVVRNAIWAALMWCLLSCTAPMKTIPDSARPLALSYQNVHDLGKKLSTPPAWNKSSGEAEALAHFLFPDNSPKGSDTFVDDNGKIFTRDELEARDE